MLSVSTILLMFMICLVIYFVKKRAKSSDLLQPPHPPLVPLLGNIPFMMKLDPVMHYALDTVVEQIGRVFRLSLGGEMVSLRL